jgi:peptidyl-prolyl cis-trans isomerase B (cyclophilin B)
MTSSNRREREIARAKFERQQARRAEREAKAKSRQRAIAIVVIAALVVAGVGWAIFSLTGGEESPVTSVSEETTDPVIDEPSEADEPSAATVAELCVDPIAVRADDLSFDAPPEPGTATGGTLTLVTNCGDIAIDLLPDAAPATVASIEFLAQNGFYDATACHRLTTAGLFVLQCGDPAGNGTGGPGYQLPDENLPSEGEANYPAGTVAMANAGPGTAGSQFFLVYEDTTLPAGYTIWGQISQGLDIVQAIADAGTADGGGDGPPAQPLVIESATVGNTG